MKRRGFIGGLITAFAAAVVPTVTFAGGTEHVTPARPRMSNADLIAKADTALAGLSPGGVLSAPHAERFLALICAQGVLVTEAQVIELDRPLCIKLGSHTIEIGAAA